VRTSQTQYHRAVARPGAVMKPPSYYRAKALAVLTEWCRHADPGGQRHLLCRKWLKRVAEMLRAELSAGAIAMELGKMLAFHKPPDPSEPALTETVNPRTLHVTRRTLV
jgi:hypothetical protein